MRATGEEVKAAVFCRDAEALDTIRQALNAFPDMSAHFNATGIRSAINNVSKISDCRLLIVDLVDEEDPLLAFRELADLISPATVIIALGRENDIRLYRMLKLAGAAEYYFTPIVRDLLIQTLREAGFGRSSTANPRAAKLVFFMGVRGGSGVTTLAVRTASLLSRDPPRPVLLMDLNLRYSDMAMQLDLPPNGAVYEALDNAEQIDDLFLERTLTHVSPSLDLMTTLNALDQPVRLSEDALLTLVGKLNQRYRYLMAEVPPMGVMGMQKLIEMPSTFVLVSDGRMSSARDVARWRAWFSNLGDGNTLVHVLNQSSAPRSLPVAQFSELAEATPDIVIPYYKDTEAGSVFGLRDDSNFGHLDAGLQPLIALLSGGAATPRQSLVDRMKSWLGQ